MRINSGKAGKIAAYASRRMKRWVRTAPVMDAS